MLNQKGFSPIIGVLVVLLILIVGGSYYYFNITQKNKIQSTMVPTSTKSLPPNNTEELNLNAISPTSSKPSIVPSPTIEAKIQSVKGIISYVLPSQWKESEEEGSTLLSSSDSQGRTGCQMYLFSRFQKSDAAPWDIGNMKKYNDGAEYYQDFIIDNHVASSFKGHPQQLPTTKIKIDNASHIEVSFYSATDNTPMQLQKCQSTYTEFVQSIKFIDKN